MEDRKPKNVSETGGYINNIEQSIEGLSQRLHELQEMIFSDQGMVHTRNQRFDAISNTITELRVGHKVLKDSFEDLKKEMALISKKVDEIKCIINEKFEKVRDDYIRKSDIKFYLGIVITLFIIIQYFMLKIGTTSVQLPK